MITRNSGVLLHPTSLPGAEGVGTLGREAFCFVDLLSELKQSVWQILPLGPIFGGSYSPYESYSAFAGNHLLIDIKSLIAEGALFESECSDYLEQSEHKAVVDYRKVEEGKMPLLRLAYSRFNLSGGFNTEGYQNFDSEHGWWLHSYAQFMAISEVNDHKPWTLWSADIAKRKASALERIDRELNYDINFWKFTQYNFWREWFELKSYAKSKGVSILGDVPLYVAHNSADVWANQDLFMLDDKGVSKYIGGVPPDYFSEDGQLWGMPVYDWDRCKESGYSWWLARLNYNLHIYDDIRIDHFRGLSKFWSVDSKETTAINGEWIDAHGVALLDRLCDSNRSAASSIVAEDLGLITDDVRELKDRYRFPGMKVLQFAFMGDAYNEHLTHNYEVNYIVYTGTHDNNTTVGWLDTLSGDEADQVKRYFGVKSLTSLDVWSVIEMAMGSVAKCAITPIQDLLELSGESRMNRPGEAYGNWIWRCSQRDMSSLVDSKLKGITEKYSRVIL